MMTAGIDVRAYTIEDNRILFVCDQRGFKDMSRVRSFVLDQKETEEFEWNSKKSKPGDKVASGDAAGGDAAADPLARFQAMQDEQAALAKRKERQAKKKAQEKKRKQRAEKKKKKEVAEKKKKEQEAKEAAAKKQQDAAPLKTEL
jgi:colicin import membrane protein